MKLRPSFARRPAGRQCPPGERAMATVVFIALLGIMLVLVMVEASSVLRLHREVKLLEHHQIERLAGPQTNVVHPATHHE